MKYNGFYLTVGRKEIFFITERKRKDKGTLNAILDHLKILPTEDRRRELRYWLSKGTLIQRYTETTKTPFWSISYGNDGKSTVMIPDTELEVVMLDKAK